MNRLLHSFLNLTYVFYCYLSMLQLQGHRRRHHLSELHLQLAHLLVQLLLIVDLQPLEDFIEALLQLVDLLFMPRLSALETVRKVEKHQLQE